MRRIVMLLTVAALMMVMLAMSVAPAFAAWVTDDTSPSFGCRTGGIRVSYGDPLLAKKDRNADGLLCETERTNGFAYYDNRQL